MEKKNWQTRLRELDTSLEESFLGSSTAIDEHLMAVMRELGAFEMGGSGDSQAALSQLAQAVECVHLLRQEAIEMAEELRDRVAESIRIPDAEGKTAFPSTPEHVGSIDVQAKTATPFARFEARKDPRRSLIGPGEILIEESFLRTALEAVEAVLEMAPQASRQGDGGPSIEDEATRAFSALRAALRCGTRAIEAVDIDDSDNAEAAQ